MRTIGLAAAGVLVATALIGPPAGAVDLTNGPAEVTLDVCAQGSSQTDTFVRGCSYVHLVSKLAPAYTYLNSQGAVSWAGGSLAGSSLSFPAAGQTWPTLSQLYIGGSATPTPKAITGTIGADGKVDLRLDHELKIGTINGLCTLTGTTELSSRGVEKLGGQAAGKDNDPTTGRFAVASTTYPAPATSLEGGCLTVGAAYGLTTGVGCYLTGTLSLPPVPAPQPKPQPQTATVELPKKIKPKGKYAAANVTKSGKLTITTTGKAKKLYVKLVLSAPAVPCYQAYSFTKKWAVKR